MLDREQTLIAKRKFWDQRQNARYRGIQWELTYDQWITIWLGSGQWHNRGIKSRDAYVMSRLGDQGPYSVDNVEIKTNYDNVMEGNLGRKKPHLIISCCVCRTETSATTIGQHYGTAKCRKKALRRGLS
jgi:hypothetical protein